MSILKVVVVLLSCFSFITCGSGVEALKQNEFKKLPTPSASISTLPTPQLNNEELCNEKISRAYALSLNSANREESVEEYNSMIQQGCDNERLRLQYGLTLGSLNRWQEAAEQYRNIIKRNPKNWYAHWTLAQTLILELNQYEEGLNEVEISKQLDDMGDIGFTYDYYTGKALDGLGRYEEAIKHYEIYIRLQSKVWGKEPKLIEAKERIITLKMNKAK